MAAPAAAKPAKGSKKTANKPADHPSYDVMIIQALKELSDKKGSSRQAIVKYLRANNTLPDKADVRIKLALKRMEKKGTLTHTTGSGASGSFLVADANKHAKKSAKPKPKKVKKPAAAKKSAKPKSPKKNKSPAKSKSKSKSKSKPKTATAENKSKKPAIAKGKKASPSKKSAAPAKGGKASAKEAKSPSKKGKEAAKKGKKTAKK